MSGIDWLAVLGGVAAIGIVNWWFFFAGREVATANVTRSGVEEVTIVVHGGYEPSRVRVHAGQRVRLVFDRQERASCSEEVVFPDFNVRRFLPAFQKTTIELRPEERGSFEFTCGMSMLRGTLVVE